MPRNDSTDRPPPPGQEVFGALWPDGPPKGWPEEPAGDYRLVLDFDFPGNVSDAEVVGLVTQLAAAMDDYHRALGYAGLELESAEVSVTAEVPAEVPA